MSLYEILIYIAASTFVAGWCLLIVDAVGGFRLIEKMPSRVLDTFSVIHNSAWILIAIILMASFIAWLAGV